MVIEIIKEDDHYIHIVNPEQVENDEENDVVVVDESQAPVYTQTLVTRTNNIEAEVTENLPTVVAEEEYRQELDEGERG